MVIVVSKQKTPDSQLRANRNYRKRVAESETEEMRKERNYQSKFRAAKSFIKNSRLEELEILNELIQEKLSSIKELP